MAWLSIAVVVGLVPMFLSFAAASEHVRFLKRVKKVSAKALPTMIAGTELDKYAAKICHERNGDSGLVLLPSNLDAFAVRMLTAGLAGRSLDVMYYMWKSDLTGMLVMQEVIAAADRGVRIRMLLDDLGVSISDRIFHAISCHPNIELRLFNPTRARDNSIWRGIEMALRFRSVNRRMHNKAWIADGRVAVVGGRNIGDEYFDAGKDANFRDLDLVMVGDVVAKTEAIFDDYWNSMAAVPVRSLLSRRSNRLTKLRQVMERNRSTEHAKPYLDRIGSGHSLEEIVGDDGFLWAEHVRVLANSPEKAAGKRRNGQNLLMQTLLPVIASARHSVNITSPYFIPGERGVAALTKLSNAGMKVSVLTNSLAATDVAAVHAGYSRYRPALLKGGVCLYELRSVAGQGSFSLRGSGQASLHTKAFSRDGQYGFIGSLNLDPRSVSLNTEMGVLFKSRALVALMDAVYAEENRPELSYAVRLDHGTVTWETVIDGKTLRLKREPDASKSRRVICWLIGWLPLESQL